MAGHHSNEALIDQIKASDQWAYYQAKDIKIEIQSTAIKVDSNAIAKYQKKKDESYKSAKEAEESSKFHLAHHVKLAEAVTIFQIAIAISAIAILSRKKILWYVALLFSGLALFFFITGLL